MHGRPKISFYATSLEAQFLHFHFSVFLHIFDKCFLCHLFFTIFDAIPKFSRKTNWKHQNSVKLLSEWKKGSACVKPVHEKTKLQNNKNKAGIFFSTTNHILFFLQWNSLHWLYFWMKLHNELTCNLLLSCFHWWNATAQHITIFLIICRRGVCARTRSWRSTGRVVSTSWARWLARGISTCLKCGALSGDCRRKRICTVTRMSQVGALAAAQCLLTLIEGPTFNRRSNCNMVMAFPQNWHGSDIIKRTAQPKLSLTCLLHYPKLMVRQHYRGDNNWVNRGAADGKSQW